MYQDKIRGMFVGVAIGDCLGACCEGWSAERINEVYGRITNYNAPKYHKYFTGQPAGLWTDDTVLTIATSNALVEAGKFDMDIIANHHIKSYHESTAGWGRTTREAIENLIKGIHWKDSGLYAMPEKVNGVKPKVRGFGNGVAMKVAPFGAYLAIKSFYWKQICDDLADLTAMTHRTSMAVSSCLAHVFAVFRCMCSLPDYFSVNAFIETVVNTSELGKGYFPETLNSDDITARFRLLKKIDKNWTNNDIIREFGAGDYYVFNSLPFSYAFFVRNPGSLDSLYDCVSSGGDCDSNGSMLGALLGALHGIKFFPKHLVDGLQNKDKILQVADKFYERFV